MPCAASIMLVEHMFVSQRTPYSAAAKPQRSGKPDTLIMLALTPATGSDSALVASLVRRSFRKQAEELGIQRSAYPNYVAFETAANVRRRIAQGARVTIALLGDRPIGTVTSRTLRGTTDRGEILRLGVLNTYRGNEFGRVLMSHAEGQLRSAGMLSVQLSIVARFWRLRAYYESLGYSATASRGFDTLPFEVLFLEKDLGTADRRS